jgi:chromosomal replication initiation ATPase DnaA
MRPVRTIVEHAAIVFERTPEELLGNSRKQPIAEARQAAMWAVRQRYPSISLKEIGSAIGKRHHTTVGHALAAVELRASQDPAYAARLQQLLTRIGQPPGGPIVAAPPPVPQISGWWQRVVHEHCTH